MWIRVTDTGIGMKQEDLSKLFQHFRQIDSGLLVEETNKSGT